jgi:O-antigen/teichoic acid export membrane protein
VNVVGESFGTLLIPHISRLQKKGETREIIIVTAETMRKLAAVYFPLYAFLIVTGREFLVVLFTEQYLASWPIFVIHLTTIPFFVLITDPIMRAHAEHRFFLLKVRVVTVVLLFVALWYGTLYVGMVGAIAIMVAFSLADRFIETAKAWNIVGVRWRDAVLLKDVGKVAIAALAAESITAITRMSVVGQRPFLVLVACGIVFACAYVAFIWLLGIPSAEEREAVRGKLATMQRLIGGKSALEPST